MATKFQTNVVGGIVSMETLRFPAFYDETSGSEGLDASAFPTRCWAKQLVGTLEGTVTGNIQESDDGGSWTDVTGGGFAVVSTTNNEQLLVFTRTKRYIRHTHTLTGSAYVTVIFGG